MDNLIIYVNGEYLKERDAKISVFDRGFLYGDGFFEGIRIYNGKIFKCDEHMDRFYDSSKYTMIPIKNSKQEIIDVMNKLIELNNIKDGYIRLVMSRGNYNNLGVTPPDDEILKPTLVCIASNITLYDKKFYEEGINVVISSFVRMNPSMGDPQCKSLNYLTNILAKAEAKNQNAQEAIFLNTNGVVTECTADNIFIIKDNKVYTPPTHTGILNGITRILVIELLKDLGYEIYEKEFTRFNLYTCDECFLTGTGAEVIGVASIDDRKIGDGKVGKHTKIIIERFRKYIEENC